MGCRRSGGLHGDGRGRRGALSARGGKVGHGGARAGVVPGLGSLLPRRGDAPEPSGAARPPLAPGRDQEGGLATQPTARLPAAPLINQEEGGRAAGFGCSQACSRFQRQSKAPGASAASAPPTICTGIYFKTCQRQGC